MSTGAGHLEAGRFTSKMAHLHGWLVGADDAENPPVMTAGGRDSFPCKPLHKLLQLPHGIMNGFLGPVSQRDGKWSLPGAGNCHSINSAIFHWSSKRRATSQWEESQSIWDHVLKPPQSLLEFISKFV